MIRHLGIALGVFCAISTSRADSNRAYVVKDIMTSPASSQPKELTQLDGVAYFIATTDEYGTEVWRSDGTPEGTRVLKDIDPGLGNTFMRPSGLTRYQGRLFFSAGSGAYGDELWASDGTKFGTVLVKDILPGYRGSRPAEFGVVGGLLYFNANTRELWKSDGTENGTVRVTEIGNSNYTPVIKNITDLGGVAHFAVPLENDGPHELWRSDGTEAGTYGLTDFVQIGGRGVLTGIAPIALNDRLFFWAEDVEHGSELWVSDGTPAGTHVLKDIWPGETSAGGRYMVAFGELLIFDAKAPDLGRELWVSDGTSDGTRLLLDIYPGSRDSHPNQFAVSGDAVFFSARTPDVGYELWKTDGTQEGTVLVKDIGLGDSNPDNLTDVAGTLFFSAERSGDLELWKSDGTETGTVFVARLRANEGLSAFETTAIGESLLFVNDDGQVAEELWISDGTETGTGIVRDIRPGTGAAGVSALRTVGQTLFFRAQDTENGYELRKSDGSEQGTVLVKDIRPGRNNGMPSASAAELHGFLLFAAVDDSDTPGLWRSDGTSEGTFVVREMEGSQSNRLRGLTRAGEFVYFNDPTETTSWALWRSDGTTQGTFLVADLHSWYFVPGDDRLFFQGLNELGAELWASDGLTVQLVKDIRPGPDGSGPLFTKRGHMLDGVLYTFANDGIHGTELWRSDGSQAGTWMVADGLPGPEHTYGSFMASIDGLLFYRGAAPEHDDGLWVSDGTEAGTRLLAEIAPGPAESHLYGMTGAENLVFFAAEDGVHGHELWVSDGSVDGTRMVKDIRPGPIGSSPRSAATNEFGRPFAVVNNTVFFVADDGVNPERLWRSDGTAAGTVPVAADGAPPLSPDQLTPAENRLYFVAAGQDKGRELWAVDVGRYSCGDMNCDGEVNAFDIEPFVLALFEPENYQIRYPDCDINLADTNGDGEVNAFDIEAFLALLFP